MSLNGDASLTGQLRTQPDFTFSKWLFGKKDLGPGARVPSLTLAVEDG